MRKRLVGGAAGVAALAAGFALAQGTVFAGSNVDGSGDELPRDTNGTVINTTLPEGLQDHLVQLPGTDIELPRRFLAGMAVASAKTEVLDDGTMVVIGRGSIAPGDICMMTFPSTAPDVGAGGCSPAGDVARRGMQAARLPSDGGPASAVAYIPDEISARVTVNGTTQPLRSGVVRFTVPRTGGKVTLSTARGVARTLSFPNWVKADKNMKSVRVR